MANAFSYMPPGQAGTPDPRMVGQMLMQPRQQGGQQAQALTRAGGGHRGNQNPHKQRAHHIAQLQHLGLSEVEAMLLGETL